MSSNIKVQRICQFCGKEFTARTTVTQYCSDECAKRAYKLRIKASKVEESEKEIKLYRRQPAEGLKAKEFLTVRDVAALLNCSLRTVYYNIESGKIKAINLAQRVTRVKRSDLDKLFEQPSMVAEPEPQLYDINDCYDLSEIQVKYGISEKALYEIIKRNDIVKIKMGRYTYVPKKAIDNLLN
ncbi:MAG: helix-turn-helix domain-containing protein [Bacteroidales bacterium]|nr:helix-turn-helix domain-containing protein [Bacteroidales bacterium]